jgi:hypothetical protein
VNVFWSIFAAVAGAAVAVGLCLALRKSERSKSGSYNPQALSVIGSALLSSFILVTAFLIAGTWSTYSADRQHTYDEARSATVAYWLAGELAEPDRTAVRADLTAYMNEVVAQDWPAMAHGRTSPQAFSTLDALRNRVGAIHPADATTEKHRADVAAALDDLYTKRSVRAADVSYSIPAIIYAALVVGSVLLIAYPPLVGLTANRRNATLLGGLGAMMGIGIFIVITLSHPFSHPFGLHPDAFHRALDRFTQINAGAVLS